MKKGEEERRRGKEKRKGDEESGIENIMDHAVLFHFILGFLNL
jgi:hypothetical protein